MSQKLKLTIESTEDGFSGFIELKNILIVGFGNTILEMLKDLMLGFKLYLDN